VALCSEAKMGDLVKPKKLNCIKLKQLTNKIINKLVQREEVRVVQRNIQRKERNRLFSIEIL
jgi:hypothetical protein